jgi:hypothetical protein
LLTHRIGRVLSEREKDRMLTTRVVFYRAPDFHAPLECSQLHGFLVSSSDA